MNQCGESTRRESIVEFLCDRVVIQRQVDRGDFARHFAFVVVLIDEIAEVV